MMFLKLSRLASGYVRFSIKGEFPERFFNLCAVQGRAVWDMQREPTGFSAYILAKDYPKLRQAARRSRVRLRVRERHGLPFLLGRYRLRFGIAVGFASFCFLLWFLSLFVWNVKIAGNDTLSTKELLALFQDYGIERGARISDIDVTNLPQTIMLSNPDIAWMSINVNGCTMTVEISERVYAPESIDRGKPCNIKASRDGRILDTQVKLGELVVARGDAVVQGDLLVSGVQEYSNGLTAMHHASAVILAETERILSVEIPFSQCIEQPTGREWSRKVLELFHLKIPLFLGSVHGEYDRTVERTPLVIGGVELPVAVTKATFREKTKVEVLYTAEQALELARAQMLEKAGEELEGIAVVSSQETIETLETAVRLNVKFICQENIAMEEDILIF